MFSGGDATNAAICSDLSISEFLGEMHAAFDERGFPLGEISAANVEVVDRDPDNHDVTDRYLKVTTDSGTAYGIDYDGNIWDVNSLIRINRRGTPSLFNDNTIDKVRGILINCYES